jgi:hypothetical protein
MACKRKPLFKVQKFFGSFFQKRTASLPLRHAAQTPSSGGARPIAGWNGVRPKFSMSLPPGSETPLISDSSARRRTAAA